MTNDTRTEGRPWPAEHGPRRRRHPLTVVVLAIVVVTMAGLLIANFATSGKGDSPDAQAPPSPSGTNGPGSFVTDEADGVPHTKDGVPVGYSRTEAGAKAAASNFQAAQSTAAFLADKDTRHKVTSVIMAPEAAAQRLKTLDEQTETAMSRLGILQNGHTADGAPLINRQAVLAAQVTSFSKDLATVELWTAAVTGVADADSTLPPTSEFNQWNYTLRWVDGDWRAVTITRSAGLVPQATAGRPSSPDSFRELGGDADAAPYAG